MTKKLFVLDTNVLLADPEAPMGFEEHDIAIPITVIEELDTFKSVKGHLGSNARMVSRLLERIIGENDPSDGVSMGEGKGKLTICSDNVSYKFPMLKDKPDNYILGTAQSLSRDAYMDGNEYVSEVVLVSKDTNVRLKARSLGIKTQDYLKHKQDTTGVGQIREVSVAFDESYEKLGQGHWLAPGDIYKLDSEAQLKINDNLVCMSPDGSKSILARVKEQGICKVTTVVKPCGIKPRNAEQRIFVDSLIDSDIDLVICNGVAGTGKTLISLACGIENLEMGKQQSLLITKAIMPVGKDIGYLKGDKDEKIIEWLAPFYDNLDYIGQSKGQKTIDKMFEDGRIEIDALTYIRGRSLMNKFVIIDEVQNLTAIQVKTIITRIADGSKLVLLGDLQQIDNPYLDSRDNGLAYAMGRMGGLGNVAILSMTKSERGRLASQAIQRL